jgi:hypothetical protein
VPAFSFAGIEPNDRLSITSWIEQRALGYRVRPWKGEIVWFRANRAVHRKNSFQETDLDKMCYSTSIYGRVIRWQAASTK